MKADILLFDGSFYSKDEISNQEFVPHPPMIETMDTFSEYSGEFYFTHFNHTDPILRKNSSEFKNVQGMNFLVATENQIIEI